MSKEKIQQYLGKLFFLVVLLIIFTDGLNTIRYGALDYDGSYNATVAANIARYGEYRISYPTKTFFENKITTGELVLLPVALLYRIFGISQITSSIVVLVYSILFLVVSWLFVRNSIGETPLCTLITSCLITLMTLCDNLFEYVSTNLVGESACLFFSVIAFYCLLQFFKKKNNKYIFVAGVFVTALFLTKSSMIFIFISIIGLLIFETVIMHTIQKKDFLCFGGGILVGWVVIDSYKFIQLRGIHNYLNWWINEWTNMLDQSSGMDMTKNMCDKIDYLPSIMGCNKYVSLFVIAVPVFMYSVRIIVRIIKKKDICSEQSLPILCMGVSGASLLVYFILFGGSGLFYARRHEVNELLIKVYIVYFIGSIIVKSYYYIENNKYSKVELRRLVASCFVVGIILFNLFPLNVAAEHLDSYIEKEETQEYEAQLMKQFLDEINELPKSAVLYCNGWWQEPQISLNLDREMISVYDVISGDRNLDMENGYFVVGRRFDGASVDSIAKMLKVSLKEVDNIEVDYDRCYPFNSYELFSIYKIQEEEFEPEYINLSEFAEGNADDVTLNLDVKETRPELNIEGWAFITEQNLEYDIYLKVGNVFYKAKSEPGTDVIEVYNLDGKQDVRFYIHLPWATGDSVELMLISGNKYYIVYR